MTPDNFELIVCSFTISRIDFPAQVWLAQSSSLHSASGGRAIPAKTNKNGFMGMGITMEFFLCVLGMVMVVEGLPYFAFPEKMKFWVKKIILTPDGSLRRFGLVLMVMGMGLIYLGKR